MALSFPPSPAIGDIYLQWQWNGSAWGPIPGGAGSGGSVSITAGTGVTVSPSPLTGTGTVALSTPVAISAGGTNATTAGAAFNAIAASGGTVGGNLSVAGNISASGQLRLGGASTDTINLSGAYTGIYAPDGSGSVSGIIQGTVASGGRTYYRNNVHQFDNAGNTQTFVQFASGGTYNVSGSWLTISDQRLKQGVGDYEHGLEHILQLRPIVFNYIGPDDTLARATDDLHVGLVADEVELVMPECVGTAELEEAGTVKTMDNGPILYALINAIKTLNERLTAAEAKITSQSLGRR